MYLNFIVDLIIIYYYVHSFKHKLKTNLKEDVERLENVVDYDDNINFQKDSPVQLMELVENLDVYSQYHRDGLSQFYDSDYSFNK